MVKKFVKVLSFILLIICLLCLNIYIRSNNAYKLINKLNNSVINNNVASSGLNSTQEYYVKQCLSKQNFIGTILIMKNNKIVFDKSYGYANHALNIKNNINTSYPIASLQKSITAALVMKQVINHRLSLSDKLNKFYPQVPNSQNITIRQLLNMTSGLKPNKTMTSLSNSDTQFINFYANHSIDSNNGVWDYQAINYYLLVGIIEKVTHESYSSLVNKEIIEPLHLRHTAFINNQEMANFICSYSCEKANNPYYHCIFNNSEEILRQELGTGNLICSANDIYKIDKSLVTGDLLGKENSRILYQPINSTYTAGLYPHNDNNHLYFTSYGRIRGYWSAIVISKNGKNAIVMLSNRYNNWLSAKNLYLDLKLNY